jgi:hypothetical protein
MRRAAPTPTPTPMPTATFMPLPLLPDLEAELIVVLAGAKIVGVTMEDDVVIDEGAVDAEADGRVMLKRLESITVPLMTDAALPAAVS